MKKQLRVLALLLAILFAMSLIISLSFMITHTRHNCIGEGCRICEQLSVCISMLRRIVAAALTILVAISSYCAGIRLISAFFPILDRDPVFLKVRLLN